MGAMKYCVVLALLFSIPVRARTTTFHTNFSIPVRTTMTTFHTNFTNFPIPVLLRGTTFHTHCTRPPSGSSFNFVTAPNARGTLEILFSCVSTLFICTWQVQHLNVPPQTARFSSKWRKPLWMFLTLLVPEILLGFAARDFLQAQKSVSDMEREFPDLVAQKGWTKRHAFYANMYGFMLKRRKAVAAGGPAPAPISTNAITFRPPVSSDTELLVLNTKQMIVYFKSLPSPIEFVMEADIKERAKTDVFIKLYAGFHVVWFGIQVCVRKARKLAITQLEVAVIAFAFCTVASYLLWWKKPQDVSVPTILEEGPEPVPIPLNKWIDKRRTDGLESYDAAESNDETDTDEEFSLPFGFKVGTSLTFMGVGGIISGAVHFLAWTSNFPTMWEKKSWQYCTIVATAFPVLVVLASIFHASHKTSLEMRSVLGIYLVYKGFLVIESFRSLAFQPAGAFVITSWSNSL